MLSESAADPALLPTGVLAALIASVPTAMMPPTPKPCRPLPATPTGVIASLMASEPGGGGGGDARGAMASLNVGVVEATAINRSGCSPSDRLPPAGRRLLIGSASA